MHSTRIRHDLVPAAESATGDRGLKIAISENLPRGAGEILRNSVWMAASVAGRTLGNPLADRTINLEVKGAVDGPSAGGLYAVGIIAALRGHQILTNATMTGTILPDGSIGEVGGIKQKLEAAQEGGMTKVIVPAGSRIDFNLDSGQILDVAAYGQSLGLSIVFADDLDEAYYELTGNLLLPPSRSPAPRGDISLPDEMMDAIRNRALKRFNDAGNALNAHFENPGYEALESYTETQRYIFADVISGIEETASVHFTRGLALLQDGQWVAAYSKLTEALIAGNALSIWRNKRYEIMPDEEREIFMMKTLDAIVQQRTADPAATNPVDSAILRARGCGDILDTLLPEFISNDVTESLRQARESLDSRPEPGMLQKLLATDTEEEEIANALLWHNADKTYQAYLYQEIADLLAKADPKSKGIDPDDLTPSLAFRATTSSRSARPLNPEATALWLQFSEVRYQSMRDALLDLVTYMDEESQYALVDDPVFRRALMLEELMGAESGSPSPQEAETGPEAIEDPTPGLFEQAVYYTREETEIAAYILRLELGQSAGQTGRSPLLRGGSLMRLLGKAARNAKLAIQKAQRAGYEVISPRHDFLMARGLAFGDVDDQFKALRLYWQAAATCQLVDACTQP